MDELHEVTVGVYRAVRRLAVVTATLLGGVALLRATATAALPWAEHWVRIRGLTAVAMLLVALVVSLDQRRTRSTGGRVAAVIAAGLVIAISGYSIAHAVLGNPAAGAMAIARPGAALALAALGIGMLARQSDRPLASVLAVTAILSALFVALVTIIGCVYGRQHFVDTPEGVLGAGMGLASAIALGLLALALLAARPSEWPASALASASDAGSMARRLVAGPILGPLVLGLATRSIERSSTQDAVFGYAIVTAATVVVGTAAMLAAFAWLARVEESLRSAEVRYRGLVESAPDAIVTIDAAGRIALVNDQFESLFGYARAEALGQPIEMLVPAAKQIDHASARVEFQGVPHRRPMGAGMDLLARRKDGTEFPVEVALSPIRLGDETVVTAVVRDVTERRRAEAERTRLLAREHAILESAPIGIVFADAHSPVRVTNHVAMEILGEPFAWPEERVSFDLRVRRFDGTPLPVREWPVEHALRGETVRDAQLLWDRAPGETVALEMNATPVRDPQGNVQGAVVTFHDVTARIHAEQLRKDYLGLISHDLRAPLASIVLYAETLQRAQPRAGVADASYAAAAILRSAQRMNHMIQDLLDTARVDAGHLELDTEPLDLGALVRQLLTETLPASQQERLVFDLPDAPVFVSADRERLERVVINLVSNAMKYSRAREPVTVRLRGGEHDVSLSVTDRGKGIALDEQPLIFEKFYRATGAGADGVGLGLYITRMLVEAHDGHIAVESEPGHGATFTVTLPRLIPAHALEPVAPACDALPTRTLTAALTAQR